MGFEIKTRYGAMLKVEDSGKAAEVVDDLLEELSTEEFEEPDDEHTQVALCHSDWSLTAQVSGLLTLDDLSWITAGRSVDEMIPSLYLRATSRGQVRDLLLAMAEGRLDEVKRAGWREYDLVPPWTKDLFRR